MAARRLPVLAQYRDDAVTRLLCAGAHLDEGFAREVDVELTEDRLRATGPSLGIDPVALARHARASVRRIDRRDRRRASTGCTSCRWTDGNAGGTSSASPPPPPRRRCSAPRTAGPGASARGERARALERTRREIGRRHLRFDYGAVDSLRERVADWKQLGFSERTDSQDFLQRLQ